MNHAIRRIDFEGIANFRDLGGYVCSGGVTKWGVFYRSTSLYKATEADRKRLKELGVDTVVDLRYPHEVKQYPDRLPEGVRWYNYSIMGTVPVEAIRVNSSVPQTRTLIRMYRQILSYGQPQIAAAIRTLLAAKGPAVFHCAAGKDRTGIIAMLLLRTVGVSSEDILSDYMVSQNYVKWFTEDVSGSHVQNMELLLNQIEEKWGTAKNYLQYCGILDKEIEMLYKKLIETD